MFEGSQFWQVLFGIFVVSVILAYRSMREFKTPSNYYQKIENKARKRLSFFR